MKQKYPSAGMTANYPLNGMRAPYPSGGMELPPARCERALGTDASFMACATSGGTRRKVGATRVTGTATSVTGGGAYQVDLSI